MAYLARVLDLLKSKDYIPLPSPRIAELLEIPEGEFPDFETEIQQHLKQGTLVKLKKNRICLPRDADLVTGIIRFRQGGSAALWPETLDPKNRPTPFQIRSDETGVSMHGDRVVARINSRNKRNKGRGDRREKVNPRFKDEPTAKVIRILERANETLTGTLKRGRMFYFVIPDEPRIVHDILVPDPKESNLSVPPQIDDKVVVKLYPWEERHLNPEGEIIEVLGKTHTPGAEYKALLHQYRLNPDFPDNVLDEVKDTPKEVAKEELLRRRDIRDQFTLTIDPQDAKDFDDAISIEDLGDGKTRIGIHIADVSAYVKPSTALNREAFNRGNSTYLVGKVIPMLPHPLSNGICSLVEDEDRLTKSVFLVVAGGKILSTEFANTVIRSNKRLTYEQAFAFLKQDNLEKIRKLPLPPKHQTGSTGKALNELNNEELKKIQNAIRLLWDIASRFRKKRMLAGSLDLDMAETKIYVDPDGAADRIVKVVNDESHQLIEEYMLSANEAVAKALNKRRIPAIHRVHDKPDAEKLDELSQYMDTVGISIGDLTTKRHMTDLLAKIKVHPQSHSLRIMVLRSLKQAQYRATADGHYGLGKQNYLHFTSPIRRYADLVVHRIFDRYLVPEEQRPPEERQQNYDAGSLASVAQHISITEQNSTDAERESTKIKLLEFFERELDKKVRTRFEAVIMDIRNHGMFVELTESMAYGFIHVSSLKDDLYSTSRDGARLTGRRSRRKFTIGQKILVSVYRVDRFKRQIDFIVASKENE